MGNERRVWSTRTWLDWLSLGMPAAFLVHLFLPRPGWFTMLDGLAVVAGVVLAWMNLSSSIASSNEGVVVRSSGRRRRYAWPTIERFATSRQGFGLRPAMYLVDGRSVWLSRSNLADERARRLVDELGQCRAASNDRAAPGT